jgi:tRNA/rRNA methyltransferase
MADVRSLDNIRIVLAETSHPGNIGAAARAMKTMGLSSLHLVRPQRFPDPEATWRALRAGDVLERATVHANLEDALRGTALAIACSARTRGIAVPQTDARGAAQRAIEVAASQGVAFVFGNETYGLTTEEVNKCALLATIPANPEYSSLNLAAAVQVFAYELWTAAGAEVPAGSRRELATHEELEGLYAHFERALGETGFFDPEHPRKLMPRLRRLFARAALETEEINILRGIIKALTRRDK